MRNKIIITLASVFWVAVYCLIVSRGLAYDKRKQEEALYRNRFIADNSPEAYYP